MRSSSLVLQVGVVFAAAVSVFGQQAAKVEDLGWMAGCWEINDTSKNRVVSEQWMKPAGGVMLGMARTVRNGKVVNYEFTRLIEKDGSVFYVAKPSQNADETFFKLVRSSANEAAFEDPAHDFPQRIFYRRTADKLTARIEGTNDGKPLAIDYPYVRTKCD